MKVTPVLVEQILSRSMPSAIPLPRLVEAVNREMVGRGWALRICCVASGHGPTSSGCSIHSWDRGDDPLL